MALNLAGLVYKMFQVECAGTLELEHLLVSSVVLRSVSSISYIIPSKVSEAERSLVLTAFSLCV